MLFYRLCPALHPHPPFDNCNVATIGHYNKLSTFVTVLFVFISCLFSVSVLLSSARISISVGTSQWLCVCMRTHFDLLLQFAHKHFNSLYEAWFATVIFMGAVNTWVIN